MNDEKIVIVDDEPQMLKSLSKIFLDTGYQIFTAESGEVALFHHRPLDPNILNKEIIGCVHIA